MELVGNGPVLVVCPEAATHARWLLGLLLLTPEVVPAPAPAPASAPAPAPAPPRTAAAPAPRSHRSAQPAESVAPERQPPGAEEPEIWRGVGLAPLSWLLAAGALTPAQYQQRLEVQTAAEAPQQRPQRQATSSGPSSSARPPPLPQGRHRRRRGGGQLLAEGVPPAPAARRDAGAGYLVSCAAAACAADAAAAAGGRAALSLSREEETRSAGRPHGLWALKNDAEEQGWRQGAAGSAQLVHSIGSSGDQRASSAAGGGSAAMMRRWSIAWDCNGGGACGANPATPYTVPSLLSAARRRLAFAMLANARLADQAPSSCRWHRWTHAEQVGHLVVGVDLEPWPLVVPREQGSAERARGRTMLAHSGGGGSMRHHAARAAAAAAPDQALWSAVAASFW
jgi:hypothetical protein